MSARFVSRPIVLLLALIVATILSLIYLSSRHLIGGWRIDRRVAVAAWADSLGAALKCDLTPEKLNILYEHKFNRMLEKLKDNLDSTANPLLYDLDQLRKEMERKPRPSDPLRQAARKGLRHICGRQLSRVPCQLDSCWVVDVALWSGLRARDRAFLVWVLEAKRLYDERSLNVLATWDERESQVDLGGDVRITIDRVLP